MRLKILRYICNVIKKLQLYNFVLQSGVTDMEEKVQYQSEERLRDIQVIKIFFSFFQLIFFIPGTNCFFRDENIPDGTPGRSTPTGSKDTL